MSSHYCIKSIKLSYQTVFLDKKTDLRDTTN